MTNSALVHEPKCRGRGGMHGSQPMYSCTHGAQINFGNVTPYLTYDLYRRCLAFFGNLLQELLYSTYPFNCTTLLLCFFSHREKNQGKMLIVPCAKREICWLRYFLYICTLYCTHPQKNKTHKRQSKISSP
jgi:hypothetical protein